MIERECFYCGRPEVRQLTTQRGLKRDLRRWEAACKELAMARRESLPSEKRLDMAVAKIEREFLRRCWQIAFNSGRGINPMKPKFAKPNSGTVMSGN